MLEGRVSTWPGPFQTDRLDSGAGSLRPGLPGSHWPRPSKRALSQVRKGQVVLGGRVLSQRRVPRWESRPCHSQACDLGCDTCPFWASVSLSRECRAGAAELGGPGGLDRPPSLPRVGTQPHTPPLPLLTLHCYLKSRWFGSLFF